MTLQRLITTAFHRCKGEFEERNFKALASRYDIRGYRRIYLVHIRKTGGTSLNHSFLSLAATDTQKLYRELVSKPDHRIVKDGRIYVGWNTRYINRGNYFYAFSHAPLHKLSLPPGTFTVTCFRDPVRRVVSHYNMVLGAHLRGEFHPSMKTERKWLGDSFDDFLDRIPKAHLCNQLYMFSARYNVDEALERASKLTHSFFTENFANGIGDLNVKTGLSLKPLHIRQSPHRSEIPAQQISRLREMLEAEYAFLERLSPYGPQRQETSASTF